MKFRLFFILFAVLFVAACSNEEEIIPPERIAIQFFEAIYVDEDINTAKHYVSNEIAELISHYQLASQVQINVLALAMTDVKMDVANVQKDLFHREQDEVNVLIQFEGKQGEKTIREDKMVRLGLYDNRWIIVKLYDDPFQVNG